MTSTQAKPSSAAGVIPHLVCNGASDALAFYKRAFGAEEMMRLPMPDGRLMHACMQINGGMMMLVDEFPEWGCAHAPVGSPSRMVLNLYVADADATVARAVEAGAKLVMPVSDMFWGDRYGQVDDPFGHRWAIATHVRDVGPEELKAAAAAHGCAEATA
ncbi:MAG: VOC family protein [Burkholderiales bacterium]|nr:VOC family protein [Burkholderiales bacterium]